jgi:hypothetical protein
LPQAPADALTIVVDLRGEFNKIKILPVFILSIAQPLRGLAPRRRLRPAMVVYFNHLAAKQFTFAFDLARSAFAQCN